MILRTPSSEHSDAKQSASLRQLVYSSEMTDRFHIGSIKTVVASTQKYKDEYSVTGFLIIVGNSLLHMLSGPSDGVAEVYEKRICSDPRHKNQRVLVDRPVDARNFSASWAAYHFLDGEDSIFGGTADRDKCRSISKDLLAKSGEGERLIGQYLMLLDLLPFRNVERRLQ